MTAVTMYTCYNLQYYEGAENALERTYMLIHVQQGDSNYVPKGFTVQEFHCQDKYYVLRMLQ